MGVAKDALARGKLTRGANLGHSAHNDSHWLFAGYGVHTPKGKDISRVVRARYGSCAFAIEGDLFESPTIKRHLSHNKVRLPGGRKSICLPTVSTTEGGVKVKLGEESHSMGCFWLAEVSMQ